jgi:hypothetical protein
MISIQKRPVVEQFPVEDFPLGSVVAHVCNLIAN